MELDGAVDQAWLDGARGPEYERQPANSAIEAYNCGNYGEAERAAVSRERALHSKDPAIRKEGARARWVMAYSAARHKVFRTAREHFA